MAEPYESTTPEDIRRQTMLDALFRRRQPAFQEAHPPIDLPRLGTPEGNKVLSDPFLFNARYGGASPGQASRDAMELVDPNQVSMDFANTDVGDMTGAMLDNEGPIDYAGIEIEELPSVIDYAGITIEEKPPSAPPAKAAQRGSATEEDRRQRMRDYMQRRMKDVFSPLDD